MKRGICSSASILRGSDCFDSAPAQDRKRDRLNRAVDSVAKKFGDEGCHERTGARGARRADPPDQVTRASAASSRRGFRHARCQAIDTAQIVTLPVLLLFFISACSPVLFEPVTGGHLAHPGY